MYFVLIIKKNNTLLSSSLLRQFWLTACFLALTNKQTNNVSLCLFLGEMPIEELMKMYAATENESTDLQSDGESSQESSEEGRRCQCCVRIKSPFCGA